LEKKLYYIYISCYPQVPLYEERSGYSYSRILLLQEFDSEIRDKKGVENSMVDHLSHLQFEEYVDLSINDYFKDDTLLKVSTTLTPGT
jgi:hypothetical protein